MKKYLLFFTIIITVVAFSGCNNGNNNETSKEEDNATISGVITYTGLKPDSGDPGTITILARKHGTDEDFVPVDLSIEPQLTDNAPWEWDTAQKGMLYDIRAKLIVNGKDVTESDITTATAPASHINIPLRVTWSSLPTEGREKSFKKISGTVKIAGYIPSGATLTIYAAQARDNSELQPEEVDNPQFRAVVKNVAASANKEWYWDEALGQIDYLIKAELHAKNGSAIGTSDIVRAAAPENDITMHINSKATAPVQDVALSGTVHLDGSYKSDSKITIAIRKDGDNGFTQIASFPAESDHTWKYTKAKNGVAYDVRAALVHKGEEIARSKQKHTVAPSKNVKLKIDTGFTLSDPTDKPYLVECIKKDHKKYDAKITFPGIGDARSYWVKVGTSKHSGNRFNEAEKPKNTGNNLTVKLRVDKDKDYYAEYAYSYCRDCTTLDSFSDFSPHVKFSCPK